MMTIVAPTGKFGCLLSSTSATLLPIIVNGGFILGVVNADMKFGNNFTH